MVTSMRIEEEFYVGFFVIHKKDENTGEFLFEVRYKDVFNNQYKQSADIKINWEDGIVKTDMGIEFLQERIE